jgi:hypothetical protein
VFSSSGGGLPPKRPEPKPSSGRFFCVLPQKKATDVYLACVKSGKTDGEIEPHQGAATPADYPLDSGIKSATAPSVNAVQSGQHEMVERFAVHNRVRRCTVLPQPAAIPVPAGAAEGA